MPKVTVDGNVHHEPVNLSQGDSGDLPLRWSGTLAQVLKYGPLSLAHALGSPLNIQVPMPAKLVGLRVVSGGPVTMLLSGPGGADQAVQVAEEALLVSTTAPFTAVKLAGTATVEVLVGA